MRSGSRSGGREAGGGSARAKVEEPWVPRYGAGTMFLGWVAMGGIKQEG